MKEFSTSNLKFREKAVISHHDNAQTFFDRYVLFDKNPYASAFTFDRKRLHSFLFPFLKNKIKLGAKILEIGSGTGYFLHQLKKENFDAIGIEPASAMRDASRKQYPDLNIISATVDMLPFPDNSFDVVFAVEVFRYLHQDDQEKGYRECLRVLKPGGYACITLVNKFALDAFYVKYQTMRLLEKMKIKELPNYCNFSSPKKVREFLVNKGIAQNKSIETTGVLFAPFRIMYKISRKVGEIFARRFEWFDEWISQKKWHKKFAGYLVLLIQKE